MFALVSVEKKHCGKKVFISTFSPCPYILIFGGDIESNLRCYKDSKWGYSTGKGEKNCGPMEEACTLQPMNESCQKSIWENVFIANLDHLNNSTGFRGKVHSQAA